MADFLDLKGKLDFLSELDINMELGYLWISSPKRVDLANWTSSLSWTSTWNLATCGYQVQKGLIEHGYRLHTRDVLPVSWPHSLKMSCHLTHNKLPELEKDRCIVAKMIELNDPEKFT